MATDYAFVVTWTYFSAYMFIFLIVSIVCAFTVRSEYAEFKNKDADNAKWSMAKLSKRWAKLLWRKKKVYGQLIPHFFDQATDLGVIFEYYKLRDDDEIGINTMNLFVVSICVLIFHRIISSAAIYHLTKKPIYMLYQVFDLLMIRCIWTNYKLDSDEPSNSQRYLQIMEATFESAPQILISTAFLVKANTSSANNPIVIISLITSFWSLSARVSGDDKLMFKEEWKSVGCKSKFPFVNCRYIIRVFLWRFLEISSRIILLCLMWINLGGLSVFVVLTLEFIYLSVICFGLQSVGIMGNVIYLVAANSNKKSEAWAMLMTRIFWSYRVLSSYLYLILVTVFAMTKFDAPKIEDYQTRHRQTIKDKVGFALFLYCWIVTPLWQWIGAVIVFDYGNLSSVGRDVDQLMSDGKLLDVLELISFGANFNAGATLSEVISQKQTKKKTTKPSHTRVIHSTIVDRIADICLIQLKQQKKVKDLVFNAAYDGNGAMIEYLLENTDVSVNVQDDQKRTPLFYAAAQNHSMLVTTLISEHKASCSIKIDIDDNVDEKGTEPPMNILQYKLTNTEFKWEKENLEIIKMLVEEGNYGIDLHIYNLAKNARQPPCVLEYLNDMGVFFGDLNQPVTEEPVQITAVQLNPDDIQPKESQPQSGDIQLEKQQKLPVHKRKIKGIKSGKAQWIKDRNEFDFDDDRPILCWTFWILALALIPLPILAAIFGPDIAALVINSKHDCNGALINGSEFVSFDVNDFILGGSITHLVMFVLILCGGVLLSWCRWDGARDALIYALTCSSCCFACWLLSWSVIGFLIYSEMDKSGSPNKQCADAILAWSIISPIQLVLSPFCVGSYAALTVFFSMDHDDDD
eukprot:593932_1